MITCQASKNLTGYHLQGSFYVPAFHHLNANVCRASTSYSFCIYTLYTSPRAQDYRTIPLAHRGKRSPAVSRQITTARQVV